MINENATQTNTPALQLSLSFASILHLRFSRIFLSLSLSAKTTRRQRGNVRTFSVKSRSCEQSGRGQKKGYGLPTNHSLSLQTMAITLSPAMRTRARISMCTSLDTLDPTFSTDCHVKCVHWPIVIYSSLQLPNMQTDPCSRSLVIHRTEQKKKE